MEQPHLQIKKTKALGCNITYFLYLHQVGVAYIHLRAPKPWAITTTTSIAISSQAPLNLCIFAGSSSTFTPMASNSSKNTNFPPKRGQIKARIFGSLANSVVSAASKVGEAVGRMVGEGGSGRNSASSTPPPTAYNSDGSSDLS
ncbi:hypothetical protein CMV_003358 [Castanea mollissima]|uniref:Uncharacterized protein n=1 Tax=Castanea mollissima TaxID=60419 RepID=A0A8J4W5H7_9ROSI|nr:hypothetical protein CMV_003358 [Castanea mollissima]